VSETADLLTETWFLNRTIAGTVSAKAEKMDIGPLQETGQQSEVAFASFGPIVIVTA
jgi:hypothetical protein